MYPKLDRRAGGRRPWSSGRGFKFDGRDVLGLLVRMREEALYGVGIMSRISKALSEMGIPILTAKVGFSDGSLDFFLVLDLTGNPVDEKALAERISGIPYVYEVVPIPPLKGGVIVDDYHFPPTLFGERMLMLRFPVLEAMIKGGYETFGRIYAVWLYHVGFRIGRDTFASQLLMFNTRSVELFDLSASFFKHDGFGIMEVRRVDLEGRKAVIRVYDSFECSMFKGLGKPMGHFVRGMLAGWASEFFGKELSAKETKCLANGDEYCEFEIG